MTTEQGDSTGTPGAAATRCCSPAAMLVPADGWIGEAPCEQHWGGEPPTGCNHLRCPDCGSAVRNQPGCRVTGDVDAARLAATDPDAWAQLPGIDSAHGGGRLYACACRMAHIRIEMPVDSERMEYEFHPLPWYCAGHAPGGLPVVLPAGPTLSGVADVGPFVAYLLGPGAETWAPVEMRSDTAFAVNRFVRSLWAHVDVARALARAVADHLDSADLTVRSRALGFFGQSPERL